MCGLYTDTLVSSQGGNKDTSTAQGTVTVRVLLNGEEAYPGEVVFCDRSQELSAELVAPRGASSTPTIPAHRASAQHTPWLSPEITHRCCICIGTAAGPPESGSISVSATPAGLSRRRRLDCWRPVAELAEEAEEAATGRGA